MSDILEDQKIHYIVKDYRRMYDSYWDMTALIKQQQKALEQKDKEILVLRSKVDELKRTSLGCAVKPSKLKGILNEMETISNSMNNRLLQVTEQTNKISRDVEELRGAINV